MNLNLQQELIKTIMGNFGISTSLKERGIISSEFITDKPITIDTGDGIIQYPTMAAEAQLIDSKIQALFVNVMDEFVLAFQMDSLPLYVLRIWGQDWIYVSGEPSYFYIFADGKLKAVSKYDQLMVAAGSEKLAGLGLSWQKTSEFSTLYQASIKLIGLDN